MLTLEQDIQKFITLALSVIIEAFPFVVLGILVSTVVSLYVKPEWLVRILPKQRFLRRLVLSFLGVLMPVCECGNIPVARSLIARGLHHGDVTAFLLAAPIINPITILSTMTAFSFNPSIVWWRVGAGLGIALIAAYCVSIFTPKKALQPALAHACESAHAPPKATLSRGVQLFMSEFQLIASLLVFGALLVAATQVLIPNEVYQAVSDNLFLSILSMMALGFVLSICSSVDAFFALAYVAVMPTASIIAFLIVGPMVDIKMLTLMRTIFKPKVLALLFIVIIVVATIISYGASYALA